MRGVSRARERPGESGTAPAVQSTDVGAEPTWEGEPSITSPYLSLSFWFERGKWLWLQKSWQHMVMCFFVCLFICSYLCSYHLQCRCVFFQRIYWGKHKRHGQFQRRLQVRHWVQSPWQWKSHMRRERLVLKSRTRLPSCRVFKSDTAQQRKDNRIQLHFQRFRDILLQQRIQARGSSLQHMSSQWKLDSRYAHMRR